MGGVFGHIEHFVNTSSSIRDAKLSEYPNEVTAVLLFLEEFCKYSYLSRKTVEGYLPAYIFDHFFRDL